MRLKTPNTMMNILGVSLLLLAGTSHAASFDCSKAASATEKLICGNEAVSALDEQLGSAYKQALANVSDKDALKQQQVEWLKQQRACKDAECLTQTYQTRIAQLQKGEVVAVPSATKTSTKKASFKITEGQGEPLCEEYLKVLNRTAWDDLQACKLPDLKGSPIQAVEFKPLSGDALKAMDKPVYERSTHKKDWEAVWPTRQHEYEIGYRKLGEAFWDLDGDGKDDKIIEQQEPWPLCEPTTKGDASKERSAISQRWETLTNPEKFELGRKYGLSKSYLLIKNTNFFYIDAEKFANYENKKYSIWQYGLNKKESTTVWADKNWVYISGVKPDLNIEYSEYNQTPSICKFWLN